jgi:hypothetical protein
MAGMGMSLRVVVPPHPLIGHWLTLLRDQETPPPLFATAMAELGRWLTYEALRDWLPQRRVTVQTPLASAEGVVVDPEVPLLVVPVLRGGLGLWQGAQGVIPTARVAHVGLEVPGVNRPPHWYLDDLPPMMFMKKVPNSYGFANPRDIEQMWMDQFDYLYREEEDVVFTMTIHPDISGRPHVLAMHERIIAHINKHEGVRWCTFDEIADWYDAKHPFKG